MEAKACNFMPAWILLDYRDPACPQALQRERRTNAARDLSSARKKSFTLSDPWHIFWHSIILSQIFFCHMLWHSIWHSFWHSIRHLFRHTFWHIFWRSFWHSILACMAFYQAFCLAFYLTGGGRRGRRGAAPLLKSRALIWQVGNKSLNWVAGVETAAFQSEL